MASSNSAQKAPADPDLRTVKQRLLEETLRSEPSPRETIRSHMDDLRADGSFPDIDYADQTREGGFFAFEHLRRVNQMALAWRVGGHPMHGDPALLEATLKALDHWLEHRYANPNWWWQRIGVPLILFRVLFVVEDELSGGQRARALELLARGELGMTGQNLIWTADITAARGCLENDPELVAEAFNAIAGTIEVTEAEGIQADWSFHQHGPCLYSGGYGQRFAEDCSRYAVLGAGTRFALPEAKIERLEHLMLDGTRWMMRGKFIDYGTVGRGISRKGADAEGIRPAAERMASLGRDRAAEFEALAARIAAGAAPQAGAIEGNRMFWNSDFMVHRREGYLTSAKMHSIRTANTDGAHNGEGLLSHYLSDGCTYLFQRGDEYDRIFGSWDWKRVPGCTIEQRPIEGNPRRIGTTAFAGGASDGACGVAGFDFERDGLTARKAWFYFDREFACLGSGISLDRGDHPVLTSVNQCHLRGDVTIWRQGARGAAKPRGESAYDDLVAAHHDGVAYWFGARPGVTVKNEAQPTDWHRINRGYAENGPPVDVFSAWIDHGRAPSDESYVYFVAPDMRVDEVGAWAAAPPVRVIENTPAVQAAYHDRQGIAGIVFYEAGGVEVPEWGRVEIDRPGVVLLRGAGKRLTLSAANPESTEATFELKIGVALEGPNAESTGDATAIRIELPGGLHAGQTVTRHYRRRPR